MWNGSDESLPAKRSDMALTVTVENVDDPGELTLQWLQPEVDRPIIAILTDEDQVPPPTQANHPTETVPQVTPSLHLVQLQGHRPRGWGDVPLERNKHGRLKPTETYDTRTRRT